MTATKRENGDKRDVQDESIQDTSLVRMVALTAIVMSTLMTPGNVVSFGSIALPKMNLTLDEESWYNSLPILMTPVGSIFTAFTMDAWGRRISMLANIIPNTVGWFLLADENAPLIQLYVARLMIGFAAGASVIPCLVYVAECLTVNNVRIRSSFCTWSKFFPAIASLFMYIVSLFLTYGQVAFVFAILSTISLVSFLIFKPESPVWLYQKGRIGDAELAQQRLRIKQPILRAVRKMSPDAVENSRNAIADPDSGLLRRLARYLSQVRRPDVYKPLLIASGFKVLATLTGVYCLMSDLVNVITVYPLEADPYLTSVISQITQIIGCAALIFLLPRYGVKRLSTISFLGTSATYLTLALCILFEDEASSNIFNYLHIASVWMIMFIAQLGVFAIPDAFLAESLPIGVKGLAILPMEVDAIVLFAVLKLFPYALAWYKTEVFFVFSAICASGVAFVAVCLPETVGKTMEEINEGFGKAPSIRVAEEE